MSSEIVFQKFNPVFKIKILKSIVDTGLHWVGRILIKSEKSQKKCLDRKCDFKKLQKSHFYNFNSIYKLKIRESIGGTGRYRF